MKVTHPESASDVKKLPKIKCSSNLKSSKFETKAKNVKNDMNCINKLNEPHPFKRVRLFGPGMNVKEQNHNRGNLSDDGVNIKIAYKARSSTKKEDDNIFYFNEHKDYCVSLYVYQQ